MTPDSLLQHQILPIFQWFSRGCQAISPLFHESSLLHTHLRTQGARFPLHKTPFVRRALHTGDFKPIQIIAPLYTRTHLPPAKLLPHCHTAFQRPHTNPHAQDTAAHYTPVFRLFLHLFAMTTLLPHNIHHSPARILSMFLSCCKHNDFPSPARSAVRQSRMSYASSSFFEYDYAGRQYPAFSFRDRMKIHPRSLSGHNLNQSEHTRGTVGHDSQTP